MARVAFISWSEDICLNSHQTFSPKGSRMIQTRTWLIGIAVGLAAVTLGVFRGFAQGNLPVATTGDQVVIKRETPRVVDSQKFRVPLSTEAIQTVTLVAPFDSKIKQVVLKTNSKGQGQSEVIRL